MKLYTEEQVRKLLKKAFWQDFYEGDTEENLISELTPIELPTDEEIEKELFYQKQVMNPYPTEEYAYTAYEKGFMEAAKWMRDKIRGGNK
jgi:hypothetical protein